MARTKLEFVNDNGEKLVGLLQTPDKGVNISAYALFAHCFTCNKDVAAASRISRSLANKGIAVFRFDFTGLGNSDGDFANTNFSSNVQDLISAAKMLATDYQAPSILIGHSLGGAAVLSAAHYIPSVKAVSTIGAPATADHVQHLFSGALMELEERGEASVKIGLREFNIKKQFLEDINKNNSADHIGKLRKALLVFHSPIDNIVNINEASKIFTAAKHPKSFITLDKADHLLSEKEDSEYVGTTLAAWATRYVDVTEQQQASSREQIQNTEINVKSGEVIVTELDKKFLRGLYTKDHFVISDEPASYGGADKGPTPYNLLLMSIGSCTSMTLRMYANRKKWPVDDINVRMVYKRLESEERITRYLSFTGDLSEEQRQRLVEIADRCPVHRTLENNPVITSELEA